MDIKHGRRGQALMELACGMFALALVVSSLCIFVDYITKSLRQQNELRVENATPSDEVEISTFAEGALFGVPSLTIKEKVNIPSWTILH